MAGSTMDDKRDPHRIQPGLSLSPGGRVIARNTVISFAGQVVPLLVGLAAIPFTIRGLGVDRFGILTLTWSLLGYVSFLQLGLGPAVTKYAAEMLGRGDTHGLPRLFGSSVRLSALLGLLGAGVLAIAAPILAGRLFHVPADLVPETRASFVLLGVTLPFVFVSGTLRGFLMAAQEFGVVTVIAFVTSSINYLAPVAAIALGRGLPAIMLVILGARAAGTAVLWIACARRFRLPPGIPGVARSDLPLLLRFGGWVSVSSATGPLLANLERFMIAGLLSVGILTYYATPSEMISRVTILPASFALTLFPAVSYLGRESRLTVAALFARSLKWLLYMVVPIVVLFVAFAKPLLALWLGGDFAERSAGVFQILAIAFLLNAIAHIPLVIVQGFGRPDIKAKLDLVEVPLYAGMILVLVRGTGLEGAAFAKFLVTVVDAIALFVFARRLLGPGSGPIRAGALFRLALSALAYALLVWGAVRSAPSTALAAGVVSGVTLLYLCVSWRLIMDARDREALSSLRSLVTRRRMPS